MERYKTIIPLETWDRKFIFETFSQREFPYVGITTPVDVTELKKSSKRKLLVFLWGYELCCVYGCSFRF